ncbi:alpha-amylase family glycosyl hydrolase [Pontibacter akesuensis]|uniref:Alpha-glucosidase n=1 Tax=Pontibacter akesuensis TaxID=388950 RepID=A0A1I7G985_9BACT|nr:alpha-amylase family glycosyl hydrolase [Pontibacter akesuensis]GHA57971.1 alpha-amylase [Pontibacter akesuensis]SFU45019.1 alpha-glucosidase [Pontibacter akesuensis]
MKETAQYLWWQSGIIYQVYPRSFQDSDGDGVGDLPGIIKRLDYLKWLGVTAVWVSPIYPSPMADFGYDISDYCGIHPLFGTMADFDKLLEEVHQRDMKLILDLVPNHTSNKHSWFEESRSSRDNPKRDWYIWHDAAEDGGEPNNWLSVFGGSAWEWDEQTEQYYYHAFLKEQPDLNWRNPEVQQAMFDVMRFWLDKGVDGFRVDVMWHMIKDKQLRNNPENPNYKISQSTYEQLIPAYSTDQPEVHDVVAQMREVMDAYDERVMIGEIYLPIDKLVTYYGQNRKESHLPFNFMLVTLDWEAQALSSHIDEYEGAIPEDGWPNWVIGNHDQPRITSRVGLSQAKVAAMLLLTLRGTPTLYYGDELGMRDVPIPPDEVKDPQGLNMPDKDLSRDPARTPMQWDNSPQAGFTDGKPWLRLPHNYQRVNVEVQRDDPYSFLSFYRKLIALRQQEPALNVGAYEPVQSQSSLLTYIRKYEQKQFLIILNMSHKPCIFRLGKQHYKGKIVAATDPDREGNEVDGNITLYGDEGFVIELD